MIFYTRYRNYSTVTLSVSGKIAFLFYFNVCIYVCRYMNFPLLLYVAFT
jgi:hypothetical protein